MKAGSLELYPLGDPLSVSERKKLGLTVNDVRPGNVSVIKSGEIRCPKKGEWFLSSAVPEAYKAPNDLSREYYIGRLVKTEIRLEIVEYY